MTRQKLAIRIVIAGFAVITGVLGIAALWLDSAQGLEWARQKLVRAGNGTIEVENARGSLLGEVQIDLLAAAGAAATEQRCPEQRDDEQQQAAEQTALRENGHQTALPAGATLRSALLRS